MRQMSFWAAVLLTVGLLGGCGDSTTDTDVVDEERTETVNVPDPLDQQLQDRARETQADR